MKRYFREWSVFFAFVAILLLLAVRAPDFFQPAQLLSMLCDAVPVLVTACGMTLVIVCRQIDISIGSQFALCSVFAGLTASNGLPMPVVAVVAVLSGAAMGAFNGLLVAGSGIPSIVVTLATMVTWREALRWWREGRVHKSSRHLPVVRPESTSRADHDHRYCHSPLPVSCIRAEAPIGWAFCLRRRFGQGSGPTRGHSPPDGNVCCICP